MVTVRFVLAAPVLVCVGVGILSCLLAGAVDWECPNAVRIAGLGVADPHDAEVVAEAWLSVFLESQGVVMKIFQWALRHIIPHPTILGIHAALFAAIFSWQLWLWKGNVQYVKGQWQVALLCPFAELLRGGDANIALGLILQNNRQDPFHFVPEDIVRRVVELQGLRRDGGVHLLARQALGMPRIPAMRFAHLVLPLCLLALLASTTWSAIYLLRKHSTLEILATFGGITSNCFGILGAWRSYLFATLLLLGVYYGSRKLDNTQRESCIIIVFSLGVACVCFPIVFVYTCVLLAPATAALIFMSCLVFVSYVPSLLVQVFVAVVCLGGVVVTRSAGSLLARFMRAHGERQMLANAREPLLG